MRKIVLYAAVAAALCMTSNSGAAAPFYITALDSARNQLNRLTVSLGTTYNRFPRTFTNGSVTTVTYGDWTSGFFPGCLWLMYQYTGDVTWKNRARSWTDNMQSAATGSDHDVGFQMMCSYGNGLASQTAAQFKLDTAVMMRGARSLRGRYNATVKAVKSWNSYLTYTYPVIIDNMMNLELLTWATRTSGDSSFQRDAKNHAFTTRKNHFRANYSSYHLVAYDSTSGSVIRKMTVQGYSDSSSWARGQAWGLYGYTMMYRETRDTAYLNQATHIADYIISRLPTGNVPFWDYDAPASPTPPRDASAAAICASALIELSTLVQGASAQAYYQKAGAILQTLASTSYTAAPNTSGNFILMHSTGHKPNNSEVDVPIIYADYYYLEALLRLKKIEEATSAGQDAAGNGRLGAGSLLRLRPLSGSGKIHVDVMTKDKDPVVLRIVDIRGRTVMERNIPGSGTMLDLTGLPRGCFAVQVQSARGFLGAARAVNR
jgi:unsaturated chondroitin disaccharide hydrolase